VELRRDERDSVENSLDDPTLHRDRFPLAERALTPLKAAGAGYCLSSELGLDATRTHLAAFDFAPCAQGAAVLTQHSAVW
jgi:hypothetical protein